MVLDEVDGDRRLVIGVGQAEAFALDACLQGLPWGRPMTCQFTAALVGSLGGRMREVRLDRIVAGAYAYGYNPVWGFLTTRALARLNQTTATTQWRVRSTCSVCLS